MAVRQKSRALTGREKVKLGSALWDAAHSSRAAQLYSAEDRELFDRLERWISKSHSVRLYAYVHMDPPWEATEGKTT